jgi:hypothetical protein
LNVPAAKAEVAIALCGEGGKLQAVKPPLQVTWFPLEDKEALEEAAIRISSSLDGHHDEFAREEGYKFLLLLGVQASDAIELALQSLGFKSFESVGSGLVARK